MSKKKKKMLIIVFSVLGVALIYDVYYFMGKKKSSSYSSPPPTQEADSNPQSQGSSESKKSDGKSSSSAEGIWAWSVKEASVQFKKMEQGRVFSQGFQGAWEGDPFLFAIEEKRNLTLEEIRHLDRQVVETKEEEIVQKDPIPDLIEALSLDATLVSGENRMALINGSVLQVGDYVPGIPGLRIHTVHPQNVIFVAGDKTYTKTLNSLIKGTRQGDTPAEPPSQGESK